MDAPHALETDDAPAATGPRRWLRFAPLVLIVGGVGAALALGAPHYLSLDTLREQRAVLVAFVAAHPWQSMAVYLGAYTLLIALCLPGALVMTLTGGFLFGLLVGGAAAATSVTAGSVVMFMVARTALGDIIRARFPQGGKMHRLEARIREHAFSYLLMLRLMPALPIFLVNIAAGFVRMPVSTYTAATLIGVIPSSLIYASIGAGLGHIFDKGETLNMTVALDPQVAWPIAALALLSMSPPIVHWLRRRRALPRALG